jgi:OPA family glycerol-3-phosphate transporter-like MFS transporter
MTLDTAPVHSAAFRHRRFLNWFPMGLTYAFLYMGRYNLTVAKNALGDLMNKEDFGLIFGIGTLVYAISFLVNGPVTDKIGGKKAILAAAIGSGIANLLMGGYIRSMILSPGALPLDLVTTMSVLYAINMYFQSAAAVAIVKVNSSWFHVRERGSFSGIFGTMISSGVFFAFSVNEWVLSWTSTWGPAGTTSSWWVFFFPAGLLLAMAVVEFFLLRDRPGQAGLQDFDTGDASSGVGDIPLSQIVKRVLTNPIILTIAFVEFCTGVLRNGVMHWFPIFAKEYWVLPANHPLRNGSWEYWPFIVGALCVGILLFLIASRTKGRTRVALISIGAIVTLLPFLQAGWGGWLFVAGVIGANVAGYVSDWLFQSRRAPAAGFLYILVIVCTLGMLPTLGQRPAVVGWADDRKVPLKPGDQVISVNGVPLQADDTWAAVSRAVQCMPSVCKGDGVVWDLKRCLCTREPAEPAVAGPGTAARGGIRFLVLRDGAEIPLAMDDPMPTAEAGDQRTLSAGPRLSLPPWYLGFFVFLLSLGVIGTHGLLSGTATMDFGGRKGAATAVGMIDGFVYLGTAVQSVSLGYLTSQDWRYWPLFLAPFAIIGLLLLTRIWNAKPSGSGGH